VLLRFREIRFKTDFVKNQFRFGTRLGTSTLRVNLCTGEFRRSATILCGCRGRALAKARSVASDFTGGVRAGIRTRRNA
jgi:hypothetical protein